MAGAAEPNRIIVESIMASGLVLVRYHGLKGTAVRRQSRIASFETADRLIDGFVNLDSLLGGRKNSRQTDGCGTDVQLRASRHGGKKACITFLSSFTDTSPLNRDCGIARNWTSVRIRYHSPRLSVPYLTRSIYTPSPQ